MPWSDGMNRQLASFLGEIGRSPEQLANTLNRQLTQQGLPPIHPTTPYKWIKDNSRPRGRVPDLVAATLTQWAGRQVTVADLGWERHTATPAITSSSEPWGAHTTLLELQAELGDHMERREFLTQSGLVLAGVANPWLLDPVSKVTDSAAGRRVGPSTVDDIERITAARRRMDDAIGGGTLLAAVREDLKVTVTLLGKASYSSATGTALLSAAAEQYRLASWLAFDTGQHGQAQHYTQLGLKAAHAAQDRQVGANILGFAAIQASVRGDGAAAEALARTGLAGGRGQLTPAVESSLHSRLAMARARLGDVDGVSAAVDQAEEILSQSDPDAEPDWIYWYTLADLHGGAGDAYLWANQPATAVPHLRQAAEGTPDEFARDRAIWLSVEATAHVLAGDLEQGRAVAERALEIIGGDLESGRVVSLFGDFCNAVADVDPRGGADFRDRLADHLGQTA